MRPNLGRILRFELGQRRWGTSSNGSTCTPYFGMPMGQHPLEEDSSFYCY